MTDNAELIPRALAVDDDAIILMLAADILAEAGFRTLKALNGEEALDLLAQHEGEVVLLFTDVQMPGIDGFALARAVAAKWPDVAIVVASGRLSAKPGDLPAGARFIAKPFSAEMVIEHLAEILPDGKKPEPLKGSLGNGQREGPLCQDQASSTS